MLSPKFISITHSERPAIFMSKTRPVYTCVRHRSRQNQNACRPCIDFEYECCKLLILLCGAETQRNARLRWQTWIDLINHRPPWPKSILKSGIRFSHRPPWLKSILKSGMLFSHRLPWLNSIQKSGILFSHRLPWLKSIYTQIWYT
jgi:hypothetical protein